MRQRRLVEVKGIGGGEQALALPGADHYDAVLLCIKMAGIDGIEVCREIQKLSPRPAVLMLTARDGDEDRARAL